LKNIKSLSALCEYIWNGFDNNQSLKARGKHHLTTVGTVSRKMCNIIFTILRESRPYETMPPKKGVVES